MAGADDPEALRARSLAHFEEFLRTGAAASLDEAVHTGEQLCTEPPATLSSDLHNLSAALLSRWGLAQNPADLERAELVLAKLERSTAADDPGRAAVLAAVGAAVLARAEFERSEPAVTRAVALFEEALALPADAELLAITRGRLARALHVRGVMTSSERDLDAALGLLALAHPDPPEGRAGLLVVQQLVALTTDLSRVASREYNWPALTALLQASIDALPPGAPERAEALSNLGLLHQKSFAQDGSKATLGAALDALRAGADDDAGSAASRPMRLYNLVIGHLAWHREGFGSAELGEAEERIRLALQLADASDGHALSAYLGALGDVLRARSEVEADQGLRREAGTWYRRAALAHPTAFGAALLWARTHMELGEWLEALEAFDVAADGAGHLFRGLDTFDAKLGWLEARGRWPDAAAVAAARAGVPERGVELLEHARSVLLGEHVQRRDADLTLVRSAGRSELADRFEAARRSGDERMIEQAIDEIRQQPGCERFLRRATFDDIAAVAPDIPVIYLCSSPWGGGALVLHQGSVRAVDLPALVVDESPGRVKARVTGYLHAYDAARADPSRPWHWAGVLDDLLGWAGPSVMDPVLDAVEGSSWAFLVPAGLMALVPWHAAWSAAPGPDGGRRYVLDRLGLASVPTMTAMMRKGPPAPGGISFAVCEPRPVALLDLPAAPLEVDGMQVALPSLERLDAEECLRDAVLAGIRRADVAHMACHAVTEPWAPADGHLIVSGDERITVRDLGAEDLHAQLIVLSACETNAAGRALPDEALTLSYALLQASANATIGSSWIAPDTATSVIMTRFYELWVEGGLPAREAVWDAQRWFRDTELSDIVEYMAHRVPSGRDAAGDLRRLDEGPVDHSHPVFWAPFVYSGR